MKVDFIICGVQKGGTTALYTYLKQHPQLCMSAKKELHFFDNEAIFASPKPNYDSYHLAFKPQAVNQLLGEATPIYMYWHDAPKRIWQYHSDIKLIVLLRNPIERAFSHWNMERSRKQDGLSFMEAITCELERCREALPLQHRVYSYVDRGFYSAQLRNLWRYFPKKNVLILKYDDFKENPLDTLHAVCQFLGIETFQGFVASDAGYFPYSTALSNMEKDHLKSIFEYEIKSLERLLDWDCRAWLAD